MANLILLQGGQTVSFPLTGESTVIGRLPECTVQLEPNTVSRRHAEVFERNGRHVIRDLGSGNNTFVNGKKIEGEYVLNHNDRIKLGPELLRYENAELIPAGQRAAGTEFDQVDVISDDDDLSTIMSSASNRGGFGLLDVRPEAKLKGIIEISRNLAGSVEVTAILPKILDTLFRIFPGCDRGIILLKQGPDGAMIPVAQKHRKEEEDSSVKLSRTVLQKALTEKAGILSGDASSDKQFDANVSIAELNIRSMMCVPMLDLDGEPIGVINLDTQNPLSQFKQEDLELLLAVAGQAALVIANARLYQSHLAKQKQDSEMRIAQEVQVALLPETLPEVDGYQFFASYEAAQAVGGDYYDCFRLPGNKVCVSFGDVAGKGVPASLVMSRIASVVQCTMQHETDLAKAMHTINNMMCSNAVEGRFVTYVLAVIDLDTNVMTLANGGHMSPIIRKPDGTLEEFPDDLIGIPIGVMEDYPYDVATRELQPGETVVIYTDGVSEAMNAEDELYGLERLLEVVRQGSGDPEDLGIAIREDVRRHANGRPQNDDITLMTFGRV